VAFSMGIHKKTVKNILETHTFGINIPNRHLIGQVEYCGLNSGNTLLKDHVFTTSVGGKTGAPLVQECPISIECTLQQTVELPKNILIIAQIENILCDSAAMMDGKVDLQKIDPVLHSMLGDYIYCAIGDKTGDAYVKNA
jgi:flavin reductase (DIM6/NTAB) family NADH-FMN oxidoreductase RutF